MVKILHVIQILTLGGGARALLATAKSSSRQGEFSHSVVSILPPEEKAVRLALESGLRVVSAPSAETMRSELEAADIVQMHWWNVPEMTDFLRAAHPAMRLIGFYHVAGDSLPHIITPTLIDYVDMSVPCNPYTYYDNPVFRDMEPARKLADVDLVYGAADLGRLDDLRPRPHRGFNVGYIGTIDFIKMHPDYVKMSSSIRIPDVKFVVCGDGSLEVLKRQASGLGTLDRFDIRGYVEDVRSTIEEFDVYGYPLCEETYAGSELNLQEVMYSGLAPVVFPYGGVKRLVVNDFTGYIVHSSREYQEAIEFLYHHPAERRRMGRNARAYAEQIFGAENAARKINSIYARLLERPKRLREWGGASAASPHGSQSPGAQPTGAGVYLDSIGDAGGDYRLSRDSADLGAALAADDRIAASTRVNFVSGILAYRSRYPADPWLRYWSGLVFGKLGSHAEAALEFVEAIKTGFPHWRAQWRLMRASQAVGRADLADTVRSQLEARHPRYRTELEDAERGGASTTRPPSGPSRPDWTTGPGQGSRVSTPKQTDPPEPALSEVLRAETEFLAGRGENAERILRDFLAANPAHARAWNNLGVVQHSSGRKDLARRSFLEAVKADPAYSGAIANLGESLVEVGLHQEAMGLCYRFLDTRPDDEAILAAAASAEEDWADKLLAKSLVRDLNYRKRPYLVTALVSTYKSAAFMRECLEDLLAQTVAKDLEIVVVDAASPEGESAIVEEFQRRHSNIRYIRTPERIGIYPAWNLAIRASSGEFLTPMSTNDRLAPDAYERLLKALEENPRAGLSYGDSYLTNIPHQTFANHTRSPDYGGVFQWPPYSYEDLLMNCRVGPHPIWRKSVHAEVGYFDGRYKAIGDQDFWLRLALKRPLVHIPVFTGLAWITKESLSGQGSSMQEILDIHNKHTAAHLERVRSRYPQPDTAGVR
ncbi:MAG: putative glycosyl transferase [Fibrobacteres bacterium]|nr:putative glycosyl transferase [Fibrobacterota bacterium]